MGSEKMREFVDSREPFDYQPTADDWLEYEQWLRECDRVREAELIEDANWAFDVAAAENREYNYQ